VFAPLRLKPYHLYDDPICNRSIASGAEFSMCKKNETVSQNGQPASASSPTPGAATSGGSPGVASVAASRRSRKPVVDQTAQTIIFCYHF